VVADLLAGQGFTPDLDRQTGSPSGGGSEVRPLTGIGSLVAAERAVRYQSTISWMVCLGGVGSELLDLDDVAIATYIQEVREELELEGPAG
jgi:hypothetical protein